MSAPDDVVNGEAEDRSAERPDPELLDLPAPRRPFRRVTLGCLTVTAMVAATMIGGLAGDVRYAFRDDSAKDVGALAVLDPRAERANTWIRGEGELEPVGGIRFERPLEADSFRLAPLRGNSKLWVQIRVPAGYENEHFVAPTFFAGRLVPFSDLGLRYSTLAVAPEGAGWKPGHLPRDAWLLIDGESPKSTRWVIGLIGVFAGFALFSLWALLVLLRTPARPAARPA